jgi:hypothetical protein
MSESRHRTEPWFVLVEQLVDSSAPVIVLFVPEYDYEVWVVHDTRDLVVDALQQHSTMLVDEQRSGP